MASKQRTIVAKPGELIHVETPLGIVNVWTGLHDRHGRQVENVEMIPNRYAGEPSVRVRGSRFVELKTKTG